LNLNEQAIVKGWQMELFEKLTQAGFTSKQALKLSENKWVKNHYANKSAEHISNLVDSVGSALTISRASALKMASDHPVVLGYDIKAKLRQLTAIYQNVSLIREACIKFPRFLGLKHGQKIKTFERAVKPYGITREHIIEAILERPYIASFSHKRIKAVIEIGKILVAEGHTDSSSFFHAWKKTPITPPYVPHTDELSAFQAQRLGIMDEPELLVKMRKKFIKDKLAAKKS
jgi:hypothetical protein